MILEVTPTQLQSEQLQQMGFAALLHGCEVVFDDQTGNTTYTFSDNGEKLATKAHYQILYDNEVIVEKAELFAVLPDSMMDNLVDVDLPYAKYTDDYGEEHRRTYSEYFKKCKWQQSDGSWLVELYPIVFGAASGNGLSSEQFRAFWEWNSDAIVDKAAGLALYAAIQEEQQS